MSSLSEFPIVAVQNVKQIAELAAELRRVHDDAPVEMAQWIDVFDACSQMLPKTPAAQLPGAIFLSLWLRRSTLHSLLQREFGTDNGAWETVGKSRFRRFPVGLVSHWPAANVPTLSILSPVCALLGGNTCLVRVPSDMVDAMRVLLASLALVPGADRLAQRLRFVSFPRERLDLHEAMAAVSDGAMIWGGQEAVDTLRRLPFPHWARVMVFGPRMSVAAVDRAAWQDPVQSTAWCQRLARDVWQFEQAACSSPQILFVEQRAGESLEPLVAALERAFQRENHYHPREAIDPSLASAILQVRAQVPVNALGHSVFPLGTDWTLLIYRAMVFPVPTQGRTLHVVPVEDLRSIVQWFDGGVQTLGLGLCDSDLEDELAELAARRGVDRIVKIGMMHIFDSPWDGLDLVLPMTRKVRHLFSYSHSQSRDE